MGFYWNGGSVDLKIVNRNEDLCKHREFRRCLKLSDDRMIN